MGFPEITEWDYPGDMGFSGELDKHAVSANLRPSPVGDYHGYMTRVHVSAHRELFFETDIEEPCDRCSVNTAYLFVRGMHGDGGSEDFYIRLCDLCVGNEILLKELAG